MYDRSYGGRTLRFEASGGLVNSALILQDRETDSYWSIMEERATAGDLRGTELVRLSGTEKRRFSDWVEEHPGTRVLSVGGREHAPDAYAGYWDDERGYRGSRARDARLPTKASVFAFRLGERRYAIAHEAVEGGLALRLGADLHLFFYRAEGAEIFASTRAFESRAGFLRDRDRWTELETGASFDPRRGLFRGGRVKGVSGVDTFWYSWSLTHPETRLLPGDAPATP